MKAQLSFIETSKAILDTSGVCAFLAGAKVVAAMSECCNSCRATPGCEAWAWHTEQGNMCHFHTANATTSEGVRGCYSAFLSDDVGMTYATLP